MSKIDEIEIIANLYDISEVELTKAITAAPTRTFSVDELKLVRREHNKTLLNHDCGLNPKRSEWGIFLKDPVILFVYDEIYYCIDGNHRVNTSIYLNWSYSARIVDPNPEWPILIDTYEAYDRVDIGRPNE